MTDLDLTLSEGVTARLGKAYGEVMPRLPTTHSALRTPLKGGTPAEQVLEIEKTLLEAALSAAGPIRKSLTRDKAMVAVLYKMYGKEPPPDDFNLPK